ncbi:MAG: T9SS type A sorting domain-containing protein, partial [Pirellulales bacterium]|nr:T9SS type A sorting domain-containing protein [Pirellulales bacterium]
GHITAYGNSTIRNCQYAVRFYPYEYDHYSGFTNITFETNAELLNPEIYPYAFVMLDDVRGIPFTGCTFVNTRDFSETEPAQRGMGIYSFSSNFEVQEYCTSQQTPCPPEDIQPCLFEKLYYGIYATSGSTVIYPDISHTDFNENYRGVYLSAVTYSKITSNNFKVNGMVLNGNYGLYLDHSTGYIVEENYFYSSSIPDPVGIGIVINHSGEAANEIYRNNFSNVVIGILAQDQNRGRDEGLQLRCNDYNNCSADEVITISTPAKYFGIAASQGSPGSNPADMAGNLFYIPGPANGDFDDINNEGQHVTYYYPSNPYYLFENVIPVDYTENTVTLIPELVSDDWTYENGCPPTEEPGGGGSGSDGLKGLMAEAEQKIDSTENLLSFLVDGGNTEALQTEVDNSIPPQTMELYNELMNKSPYLSDTVVSTAIEKEDVLPGVMLRDVMVANPHTAKSDELMTKLDERWIPLPEYMKAQILQGRSIVSIREETESKLIAYKLERAKAFNALAWYYLNDTINSTGSLDSLTALYLAENDLTAKYSLAFLYMDKGDIQSGQNVLNNIPTQFDLNSQQQTEYQQMAGFYGLLSSLAMEDKSILEVDSLQTLALYNIEASQAGLASAYARNALLALNEIEYDEPIILSDLLKSSEALDDYEELLSKAAEAPGYIKVHPNPAKDYIIVRYETELEGQAEINIYNISGKLKYSGQLKNIKDQVVIGTKDWKAGVYITTLKLNGKMIESVKFTLIE